MHKLVIKVDRDGETRAVRASSVEPQEPIIGCNAAAMPRLSWMDYGSAFTPDFAHLTTRSLVVYGYADESPHLTVRGADWHADPFHRSPGAEYLLTLFGAKHGLGGIAGYDAKETDDENPDRLEVTRRLAWAYQRSALSDGDAAWAAACKAMTGPTSAVARIDRK